MGPVANCPSCWRHRPFYFGWRCPPEVSLVPVVRLDGATLSVLSREYGQSDSAPNGPHHNQTFCDGRTGSPPRRGRGSPPADVQRQAGRAGAMLRSRPAPGQRVTSETAPTIRHFNLNNSRLACAFVRHEWAGQRQWKEGVGSSETLELPSQMRGPPHSRCATGCGGSQSPPPPGEIGLGI
jgi:hypothetical protein